MRMLCYALVLLFCTSLPAFAQSVPSPGGGPDEPFVITADEIKTQGWQTLEDVIANVPGMVRIDDYFWFGSDNFSARGFFSAGSFSTFNIMVNGVSRIEDWYDSFPLNQINVPVEAIERVEVRTGVGPATFGNHAFLGSINIVTSPDADGTLVTGGAGSNGQYRGVVDLARTSDDLSMGLTVGVYGNDGVDVRYDDLYGSPGPGSRSKGQLTDRRMFVGATLRYRDITFESQQNFGQRGVIDFFPGIDDGHLAEVQSSSNVLGYETMMDGTLLRVRAGYHSFRNRLDYRHTDESLAYTYNDIYSDAVTGRVDLTLKPGAAVQTSLGASVRRVLRDKLVVDAPNLSDGYVNLDAGLGRDEAKTSWSAHVSSTYTVSDRLDLSGVVRLQQTPSYHIHYQVGYDPNDAYEQITRTGTFEYENIQILPQAVIRYRASERHRFSASVGTAVKDPSIGENIDIVRYPSRPQLEPARIVKGELRWYAALSPVLQLETTLFHKEVDDLIARTNALLDGELQLFNTNSGKLRTTGMEFTTHLDPNEHFDARATIVFQRSRNLQDGYKDIDLEYAPGLTGNLVASWRFMDDHTIGLSARYVGEMATYWAPAAGSTDPAAGARIGDASPAVLLGTANIRFNDLFERGVFAYVTVDNLLDANVVYPATRSNGDFTTGTRGPGRRAMVGVGIDF